MTRSPMWYNNAEHLTQALKEVLDEQRDLLHSLAERRVWNASRVPSTFEQHLQAANQMRKIALLASRSGEHDAAIALLQSMQVAMDLLNASPHHHPISIPSSPRHHPTHGRSRWTS